MLEQGDEFTLEFEECGVQKLYTAYAVEELRPFCSFFDIAYSRHMGLGLDASETLGLGHQRCKMRFCPGRETQTPKALEGMFE
ncbi:MAG: L-2-amino-thiazoline-4-carboxylic acid hydrolase [bacterium]|nr:L-2-amino-thiazoline-4-carboxylic acid hydrolase [bacterium]